MKAYIVKVSTKDGVVVQNFDCRNGHAASKVVQALVWSFELNGNDFVTQVERGEEMRRL